ncbi:MAG: hypothetical protein H0U95_15065 [Bacteroidetes bacterium]|nr:hypothetical protein [Bacteroidota bacterium]
MRSCFIILFLIFIAACSENDKENRKTDASFSKEISDRIKLLSKDSVQTDSLKVKPNEVDSIVNTLILLSKDIENISASVNRSNTYFSGLATKYSLSDHEFIKLKNGMHVDAIATILKDNELKFFNLILLKNNRGDALLHSAQ